MKAKPIISHAEALQILRNDLRRAALEKRAAELREATPESREKIIAEIDQEIHLEIKRRAKAFSWRDLI